MRCIYAFIITFFLLRLIWHTVCDTCVHCRTFSCSPYLKSASSFAQCFLFVLFSSFFLLAAYKTQAPKTRRSYSEKTWAMFFRIIAQISILISERIFVFSIEHIGIRRFDVRIRVSASIPRPRSFNSRYVFTRNKNPFASTLVCTFSMKPCSRAFVWRENAMSKTWRTWMQMSWSACVNGTVLNVLQDRLFSTD